MTDSKSRERARAFFHSLYVRLILVILSGIILGFALFMLTRWMSNYYISNYYTAEERKDSRELDYIEDLRNYVITNELSSEDTEKIAKWAKDNRYVYLLIYKNNELFFSSDMLPKPEENGDSSDGGTGAEDEEGDASDVDTEQKPDKTDKEEGGSYGSGITVDYPTRDELKKYAEENDLYELELSDGVLFASVAEFTEYFYYDLTNIVSLVVAAVALSLILINYFRRIIKRVRRLDRSVMVVADGDINSPIQSVGYDEIARLSTNVEHMRRTIIERIQDEREARQANTELITAMSHDIRTPLTVLLGYLEIMKSEAADDSMRAYVEASEKTAMRLKGLSDDMFNYFLAFGSTKENFTLEKYDAHTLFDQLLSESVILLEEQGFDIRFDFDFDKIPIGASIVTDAPKLMRIVDNIFSNLSKYAEKNAPVEINLSFNGEFLTLEVKNRIKAIQDDAESNGIGLKTCQRLAAFVAERFEFEDDGNDFTVRLVLKAVLAEECEG